MVEWLIHLFRASYDTLYIATFIVAVFLLLSGLDDLFIDIYYWLHYILNRRKFNKFRFESIEKIINLPEKPIAVYIPAWHEQDVIGSMLLNTLRTLQYRNFDIFVGVYPNDPATVRRVEEISRSYPKVHPVIGDQPGPTTKANNLNHIHEGMIRWENKTGIRYDIVVVHDSEDVIHPMSLKVHNSLIPDYDMVQLPVFPLNTEHMNLVHWTYADEFAENHTKDLFTRQYFSGFVPSAGVGTAFNRWIIEFIGSSYAKNIFRSKSLTEDYDLALRLALGKAHMLFTYKPYGIDCSTRGYFPHTMRTAIRQKSRWITGICLQSWQTIGWRGDARFKFVLYRDRKAVITNMINFFAYLVLLYLMMYEAVRFGFVAYQYLPPIVIKGTTLWYLVIIDSTLMIWRILHRFITVKRVYGMFAAALSIVRQPVANIINFSATARSVLMFLKSLLQKKELKWEKTKHHFPAATGSGELPRSG